MKLMAKILSVSFLVLISFTLASAQLSLGLKAGVHLAKDYVNNDEIRDITEFMPVVYFAIPFEVGISDYFAIQAEPSFIQKGMKMVEESTYEYEPGSFQTLDMDTRMTYNFLSLPILVKGKIGPEALKIFVVAGPEIAYALDGKAKIEMTVTNGTTETMKETEDINFEDDGLDRWDYGLILGAGVEAQIGSGWITLDGRYNLGLNNYNQNEDENKFYHRGIGILVGYKVPIQ